MSPSNGSKVLAPIQSFMKIILLKLFSLNQTLIKNIVPSDSSNANLNISLCTLGPSLLARPSSGGSSWTREQTLVVVKPDGVQWRLVGYVIQRFERRGFKLVGMKMLQAPERVLAEHYHDLQRKPFYPALISYMTSGPVVAMVWEGPNVVCSSRAMVGHTNSAEAAPDTIRGDFSIHISRNIIHASDSVEGAQKEIQLWFQSSELVNWADKGHQRSIYPP
ncbi:nucleoside diphosphate kinase, mitochondrial-like [Neomonachus schauinslandi]|uniref:Nucleoside diphosphate kinase n=1 Tax=Neomonachus schauinslandi TaxID=29088 RepID=A0A2Y9H0U8_NEOSC|nr:nucleoside diphosphate kinase, mitochondrial-like [Neomonachus schauinslandi]